MRDVAGGRNACVIQNLKQSAVKKRRNGINQVLNSVREVYDLGFLFSNPNLCTERVTKLTRHNQYETEDLHISNPLCLLPRALLTLLIAGGSGAVLVAFVVICAYKHDIQAPSVIGLILFFIQVWSVVLRRYINYRHANSSGINWKSIMM